MRSAGDYLLWRRKRETELIFTLLFVESPKEFPMSTETKPRRRARQRSLSDDEGEINPPIPEIEQLGDRLEELRAERGSLGAKCKEIVHELTELMQQHKKKIYTYANGKTLHLKKETKEGIKIEPAKRKKQKGESDFGGE